MTRMQCSPTRLFFDMTLWGGLPMIYQSYKDQSIQGNFSNGEAPDCVLITVPCDSEITKIILTYDDDVIFWSDLILVYILFHAVVVTGVICNILNIVIFSSRTIITDSTNNLLLGLAVSDLLSLLVNLMELCVFFLCFIDSAKALTAFNLTWIYSWHTYRFLNVLSLELVAVISVQRAAALVLPFKVATMFSQKRTNIIIAFLIVLCAMSTFFHNYGFYPLWIFHYFFNEKVSLGFGQRWDSLTQYDALYIHLNVRSVFSICIIFISGSLTVYKVNYQARNRASLKADFKTTTDSGKQNVLSNQDIKVVKMSLTVCLVTFIAYICATLVNIAVQSNSEKIFGSMLTFLGVYCTIILFSINSTVNFFLYIGMSTKFKESFNEMILCRRSNRK